MTWVSCEWRWVETSKPDDPSHLSLMVVQQGRGTSPGHWLKFYGRKSGKLWQILPVLFLKNKACWVVAGESKGLDLLFMSFENFSSLKAGKSVCATFLNPSISLETAMFGPVDQLFNPSDWLSVNFFRGPRQSFSQTWSGCSEEVFFWRFHRVG